jgi:uncharacterized repeat protein (TIGR02543 family)
MNLHGEEIVTQPGPNAKLLLVYSRNGNPLNLSTEGPIRTGIVGDDNQITDGNLWSMWVTSLTVAPPRQPVITGLSPANGPITGALTVTITGLDLSYATAVKFGEVPASGFTVIGSTEIRAEVPQGLAGSVYVSVTTPGGTTIDGSASAFRYDSVPVWTVTWNANKGVVSPASTLVEKSTAIGTPPVPTRDGYKFLGWYTAKTGGTKLSESTKIKKNVTYYAQWVQLYTITWDANGGVTPKDSSAIQKGKAVGSLPKATRTGYSLKGWYTAKTGGSKIAATTVPAKSRTYYAQWTAKTYTLTYEVNGGKALKTKTKKLTFGKTYGTLSEPTQAGHKFLGWYTAANDGDQVTKTTPVTTAANHTLYAHWAEAWTVTWNANGGKNAPASMLVVKEAPLGTLPAANPTRTGYSFSGWGTTANAVSPDVTEETVPAGNTSYYALWTAKSYKATFHANGGKIGAETTQAITETYAATYILPADPARAGYKFLGWYTAKSDGSKITAVSVVKITKATTFYAHWTAAWTVTWNTNSPGEVETPPKTLVQKDKAIGTLPVPACEGYTFKGWYTKASAGSKVSTKTVPTKNVTYYAQWTQNG